MKNNYLEELKGLLNLYQMEDNEVNDIVNDYDDMYNNWIETGMSEEEVESKLGTPRSIIKELTEGYRRKPRKQKKSDKVIAVSPFVALVIFMVLGFGYDLWAYSWMAFLLIPITAIIAEMDVKENEHVLTALSPFIAVIGYFILGFVYGYWHPGWLIFLIIPVIAIFNSRKSMSFLSLLISLSPFAALVAFFYLGELGHWQQGWLVFLIIPILGAMEEKSFLRGLLIEFTILIGAFGYLFIGYTYGEWNLALLAFLPALAVAFAFGYIEVNYNGSKTYWGFVLLTVAVYLIVSLAFGYWNLTWLIFLAIPVFAIVKEVRGSERVIALTPFLALVLFFMIGFLFDGWVYAWLAFLIIPVTAIVANNE